MERVVIAVCLVWVYMRRSKWVDGKGSLSGVVLTAGKHAW